LPPISRRTRKRHSRADRSHAISRDRATRRPELTRSTWAWLRLVAGALVLAALVQRLGAGPFLDGFRRTSAASLLAALAITAVTTLCSAWRWRLVADRLGVRLDLATAVAAVYRAQFLNATLPGGVLGDVDRAVGNGRDRGAVGPTVRSVVWERTLGQAVQVVLTVVVLIAVPSALRPVGAVAAVAALVLVLVIAASARAGRRTQGLPARAARAIGSDVTAILRPRATRLGIAVSSAVAVTGHVAVFLVAARVAGVSAPAYQLLPLAAVVLLAAAIPLNVAGWGPREGVAAWAFGMAGLGTVAGVTTAVVYGVMALVATLPGAVVLLAGRRSWRRPVVHPPLRLVEEVVGG
jgi:uncharacterized membrane protein YbhN (UPF0104 family)